MRSATENKQNPHKIQGRLLRVVALMILLVGTLIFVLNRAYSAYTADILYSERLNQMQEVTVQLFNGLEDVVENQWYNAEIQTGRICTEQPTTMEQLRTFMDQQAELSRFERMGASLIAVDSRGRYYTQEGPRGLLSEMELLADAPEQISFVSSSVTKERTQMFFLYRLDEPLRIQDGSRTVELTYYGVARDMAELNQYFSCDAYEGKNAIYVLDEQGTKLFSGENGNALLEGFNAYTVLQSMEYLHGSTFENTMDGLKQTGIAYSNAVLNGEECYYALYQMDHAAWVLLFMIPSRYVAVNTVELVNSTTRMVLASAVFMALLCTSCIYWFLRRQQALALRATEETNAVLKANNEKLMKAQEATTEALQIAEAASKAKTDFLSNMSHDIRTPMNAIIGLTTLMKNEPNLSERMRDYLNKLENSGHHLLELINNVLDMNRIESGKTTLNAIRINLAEQITQVETIIGQQAEQRAQTFTIVTTHLNHEHIIADPARLQQILINILSNAVKYTAKGGHILFEIEELPRDEHYAKYKFIVQDDGMGMSQEYLDHIFDPFSRMESSVTNQIQGTGLGMAITKSVVDLMGGVIHVDSTLGKGSRFEVTLEFPIDTEADQNVQHLSVLLVECAADEDFQRIQDAVAGRPVHLHRTQTWADALHAVQQATYDVVLMSLSTPESDVEQLRQLADPETIFLGAAESQSDDVVAASGLDGVLAYPFFLSNLENEVHRVQEVRKNAHMPEARSPLHGMRFLCAEDNEINAEILQMLLESKGASCTIYHNGQEIVDAFEKVQPGDYDMILMDVQMPVMDGLEATRRIRSSENPLGCTIPILAMTANAFLEDRQQSRDAGMDEHLSKPIDIEVLEQTVRRFHSTPRKNKKR